MKIQTRNVKLAIKKGNEIIADYKGLMEHPYEK